MGQYRNWNPAGVAVLVLALLPACQTGVALHPEAVAALATWPAAPEREPPQFTAVAELERGGLPEAPEAPAPYLLGAGDVVEVRLLPPAQVSGLEEPVLARVRPDGLLYVPRAGKIKALGRTATEVEDEISQLLQSYIADPFVSVEVKEYQARRCRVMGEGVTEEQYLSVDGKRTLLEALVTTGATRSPIADRDEAYLIRGGVAYPFSIGLLVESADSAADIVLIENDHVLVPAMRARKDYVYVFGQVRSPARIPMDHTGRVGTRGKITLAGAIGSAQGIVEATADCNRVCIFRGGWRDVRLFTISVPEFYRHGESIQLEPGDRVYVAATGLAHFNFGLQQFLPSVSGAASLTGLFLSAAAVAD